jgi:hypothetical protein
MFPKEYTNYAVLVDGRPFVDSKPESMHLVTYHINHILAFLLQYNIDIIVVAVGSKCSTV